MVKVKISTQFPDWPLLRQTSQSKGIVGDCIFFVDDKRDIDYDYWIVYDDILTTEEAICNGKNLILITPEPPSVKQYSNYFLSQFNTIITCHKNINHRNIILDQQALPWHIGRDQSNHKNNNFTLDYDSLSNININNSNRKLLSVIISNKSFTSGHRKRIKFVKYLMDQDDISIDVFGRGFNEVADKWDVIYNYKYHLVLENTIINDYWTEKLSDCLLGGAYPIFSGAPNISKYFDKNSITKIDLNNFYESKKNILKVINNNKFEDSFLLRMENKKKILDDFNLFPFISNLINLNKQDSININNKRQIQIIPNNDCRSIVERIKLKINKSLNKYL